MDSTNAVVGTVTNQAVTTPLQATGSCDILNLTLGPLDLNLLGLRVQLLGNLLCAAAGLLDSPTGGGGGWHRQSAPVDRRVAEPDPRPARRLTDHGSAGAAPAPPRHYAATLFTRLRGSRSSEVGASSSVSPSRYRGPPQVLLGR
jgi:hypothetical protein